MGARQNSHQDVRYSDPEGPEKAESMGNHESAVKWLVAQQVQPIQAYYVLLLPLLSAGLIVGPSVTVPLWGAAIMTGLLPALAARNRTRNLLKSLGISDASGTLEDSFGKHFDAPPWQDLRVRTYGVVGAIMAVAAMLSSLGDWWNAGIRTLFLFPLQIPFTGISLPYLPIVALFLVSYKIEHIAAAQRLSKAEEAAKSLNIKIRYQENSETHLFSLFSALFVIYAITIYLFNVLG